MFKTFLEKNLITPKKKQMLLGILCWVMFDIGFALLLQPFFNLQSAYGVFWYQISVFCACFLLTAICFLPFLKRSQVPLGAILPEVLKGYGIYWVLSYSISVLISLIERFSPTAQSNPNQEAVTALLIYEPLPMILCTALLVPITEECLVRGMIFGPICRKKPWLAYVISSTLFALLHVVSSIGEISPLNAIENILGYIPSGIVLGWIYQRTRTIIGPIALHCLINLVSTLIIFSLR